MRNNWYARRIVAPNLYREGAMNNPPLHDMNSIRTYVHLLVPFNWIGITNRGGSHDTVADQGEAGGVTAY